MSFTREQKNLLNAVDVEDKKEVEILIKEFEKRFNISCEKEIRSFLRSKKKNGKKTIKKPLGVNH